MDKKSVLALILIAVVILILPYYQKIIMGDEVEQVNQNQKISRNKDVPDIAPEEHEKTIIEQNSKPPVQTGTLNKKKLVNVVSEQDSLERKITLTTNKIHVTLSNIGGGSLDEFILKKYSLNDSQLVNMIDGKINNDVFVSFQNNNGDYIETDKFVFKVDNSAREIFLNEDETYTLNFSLILDGDILKKTYTFYGNSYHFDVAVHFSNPSKMLLNKQYQFGWKNGLPSTESYKADDNTYKQAYVYMGEELENYEVTEAGKQEPVSLSGKADWLAVRTKYFLGSVSNLNPANSDGIYFYGEGIQQEGYIQRIYTIGFNSRYDNSQGDSYRIYLGPLDNNELSQYGNELDVLIMNNGWYERVFRFFSLIVLKILELLHKIIPNYGIVIIIFSILIKLLVYPLTRKSYTSMKEMQKVGPLVAELKEKYKGDPQRLNKETMKLYKEHGVNPLGGCLPTLIQMPLLIALFIVFRSTIQLRGAMFIPGWVPDLSQTDTLFTLPFSLPMYGNEFNLLPILMAATMFFQSKMTMQDPKQKAMIYMMPVFMLLIFNRFPSGLNLYYTLFNLLTIIQQKFISKASDSAPIPVTTKKTKNKK